MLKTTIMNKIKLHILIVLGIFVFGSLIGQENPWDLWLNAETDDFATIQQNVESYYADKDKGRGSGYKQFKRWEYLNQHRLTKDGKVFNYTARNFEEYQAYIDNTSSRATTYGYWDSKGPTGYVDGNGWNGGVGRVNCITFHPTVATTFWVGTPAGGLWKTTNSGTTWTPLTDGMPRIGVSSMVVNYNNTNHMYLLTGDGDGGNVNSIGILKTLDGGETWENTSFSVAVTQNYRCYKLLMHPTNPAIMFVVSNAGILKTTNSWATYTTVLSVPSGQTAFYDIEFKPGAAATMYACTKTRFYRSTNTGSTWTQVTSGVPTTATRMAIGVTPNHTPRVYLFAGPSYTNGTYVGMYRSNDNGLTFATQSTTPNVLGYSATGSDNADQTTYDHAMAVSRTDYADIMVGGINCWVSANYGWNWSITSVWDNPPGTAYTHADIHALEINPLNNKLYCGSDGGIFVCSDFGSGNTWTDLTSGLAITQSYRIAGYEPTLDLIINGTQDNGSNKWTGGSTMLHVLGADGMDCMIDHSNSNILYNSTQGGGLRKSTNGGATYAYIAPTGGSWVTPYVMNPSTATTIYGGYSDVYKSTNGGSTWSNMGVNGSGAMAIGTNNTNRVYASADGSKTIYMSSNGGASWTTNTGLPTGAVTFIAVNPLYSLDVFVVYGGYTAGRKVFRSTDAGATWTNISGSLPNIPINCIAYENTAGAPNDALYIGTDVGVYYRDDDIGDWIPFMNGLPATMVFDLEINETSGYIMAATYGRGFWRSQTYGDCVNLSLTQANDPSSPNYTGFQHYEALSYLTSSRIITGGVGTDVSYQAADYVKLTTGFHAQAGNKFVAKLGPCDGTGPEPPPEREPLSGIYVGTTPINPSIGLESNYVETEEIIALDALDPVVDPLDANKWGNPGEDDLSNDNSELSVNIYPNPFYNSVTIEYELNQPEEVEIYIFDQKGNLIERIVQNNQPGKQQYLWNVSSVPKGMYIVYIKTEQETAKRQIIKYK